MGHRTARPDDRQLVRCLDCGAVYPLPRRQQEADACPECDGVGWIALAPVRGADKKNS